MRLHLFQPLMASLAAGSSLLYLLSPSAAASPPAEPVVARVEMRLATAEDVIDVIEKGDLLTVLEERDEEYLIVTHDGVRGIVDKVNALRIAESADVYTDLIKKNPDEGRYHTLRASSWWALGKADKALSDFDEAIKKGYEAAHAYSSRGLFYASRGDYSKAIADYGHALELDPEDLSNYVNRAAARMGQGAYEKAIADYNAAIELLGESDAESRRLVPLLRQRAIAKKAAGKFDEAIHDFNTILEANESDAAALMGRGFVHFQRADHEAAVSDFSRVIELNPEDAVAWNNRGYNQFRLGKHEQALGDYDEAIRLAPNYSLALQNRAWLLATTDDDSLRDPELAIKSARQACELTNFENMGDLSALAAALAAAGDFKEAIGWQEKVVEAAVDGPFKELAEKNLRRYQDGKPFVQE